MAATVNITPIGIDGQTDPGTIDVALCGYGSRSPVSETNGSFMESAKKGLTPTGSGGSFSITLIGNDQIEPAGTYYTITYRNANGDILQCNAYIFLDGETYDLADVPPFDPNQPSQPLPPFIGDWLVDVPATAPTTDLPGNKGLAFYVLLTENIPTLQVTSGTPGFLYTLVLQQDGTGGRTAGRPQMTNAAPLNAVPNGTTTQTFLCFSATQFLAIAPATYS